MIIYWHIFHNSGFHHICNIKCRLDCRHSPQNIFNATNFNPHKKSTSLLNVPICAQGMQRTWWPEGGTIIVTGQYWTLRNKLQWNSNQNTAIFIQENVLEKVICKMVAILSRLRWVDKDFSILTMKPIRGHVTFNYILKIHVNLYSDATLESYYDGLVQERHNRSALAMELRLSCTNPSIIGLELVWASQITSNLTDCSSASLG